jgi:ribonuclease III
MNTEITEKEIVYKEKNPVNIPLDKNFVQGLLDNYNVGHKIKNFELFQRAFTHNSYIMTPVDLELLKKNPVKMNEQKIAVGMELKKQSYEVLEYLGDAILESVVSFYLMERYWKKNDEAFYSEIRKRIVCGKHLCKLSLGLGFDKYFLLSKHEEENEGRTKRNILEDVFEAFIGGLAMDAGEENHYPICQRFIVGILEDFVDFTYLINHDDNYKTQLINYYNDHNLGKLRQSLVKLKEETLGNGKKQITVAVKHVNGDYIGIGVSHRRKDAEQRACKNALIHLGAINSKSDWLSDSESESD